MSRVKFSISARGPVGSANVGLPRQQRVVHATRMPIGGRPQVRHRSHRVFSFFFTRAWLLRGLCCAVEAIT